MHDPILSFVLERNERINKNASNSSLLSAANSFNIESNISQYSYNFSWLGRPIIQYPQDMIAMQEIIWDIKPELIIETGIAHGGSLIFYASLLEMLNHGRVLGIDIDIRSHNRTEIEKHSMCKRIDMLQGSSIDPDTILEVEKYIKGKNKILVVLDSNHTHAHVLDELSLYSKYVSLHSYIVVFDTIVEYLPNNYLNNNRPWNKGNNPMTAVNQFLSENDDFNIDKSIDNKLMISVAPNGYLKKIK